MSYDHGKRNTEFRTSAGLQAIPTQTPAVKASMYAGPNPIRITGISAVITTAITVTSAVLNITKRPTPGSSSGETTLATITLPVTGSAIGDCVYKRIAPVDVPAGSEVTLTLATASTAGAAVFALETEEAFESAAGNSKLKLSA